MTAPVIQELPALGPPERADVERSPDGGWRVSFVLPGSLELAEYPQPLDPRVTLRDVPTEDAVALRWAGRWTSANVDRHVAQLEAWVAGAGWRIAGPPRWARFDPPWKPSFARRNEIVIPVEAPA
jgi:hypothetical protein